MSISYTRRIMAHQLDEDDNIEVDIDPTERRVILK